VTPLVKANATARYEFTVNGEMDGYAQASMVFEGRSTSDLRLAERSDLGPQRPYTSLDLSAGLTKGDFSLGVFIKNIYDERGEVYRYSECPAAVCSNKTNGVTYIVPIQPRTFGIKFAQKF
jgi:hypothetical protein